MAAKFLEAEVRAFLNHRRVPVIQKRRERLVEPPRCLSGEAAGCNQSGRDAQQHGRRARCVDVSARAEFGVALGKLRRDLLAQLREQLLLKL